MSYRKGLELLKSKLEYEFMNPGSMGEMREPELERYKKKTYKKVFLLSASLSIPVGGLAWFSWVADAVTLVKLQIKLLRSIAYSRGIEESEISRLLFWCFAAEVGLDSNKVDVHFDEKVTIKGALFNQLSEKLTLYLLRRSLGKLGGWMLAPLMGYFSYSMTKRMVERFEKMLVEKAIVHIIPKIPITKLP
jgi:hypothetical protein